MQYQYFGLHNRAETISMEKIFAKGDEHRGNYGPGGLVFHKYGFKID
jgi:hypothetical protein